MMLDKCRVMLLSSRELKELDEGSKYFVFEWHDWDTIPKSNIRFYLNKMN